MKKSMGILIIVTGVILTIVGFIMARGGSRDSTQSGVSTIDTNKRSTTSNPYANTSHQNKYSKSSASTAFQKASDKASLVTDYHKTNQNTEGSSIDLDYSEKHQSTSKTQDKTQEPDDLKTSKEKGDEFEDFTVNLLADRRMKLLRRTQDKMSSGGVVAESCKEPDLHVEQKRGNSKIDYHLECKYRSRWTNNIVKFEEWQLKRYRQFQKDHKRKVLIALGVGGSPSKPQTFMIVPIDSIKDNSIHQIDESKYAVSPTSDGLAKYIELYFDEVFTAARKKRKE